MKKLKENVDMTIPYHSFRKINGTLDLKSVAEQISKKGGSSKSIYFMKDFEQLCKENIKNGEIILEKAGLEDNEGSFNVEPRIERKKFTESFRNVLESFNKLNSTDISIKDIMVDKRIMSSNSTEGNFSSSFVDSDIYILEYSSKKEGTNIIIIECNWDENIGYSFSRYKELKKLKEENELLDEEEEQYFDECDSIFNFYPYLKQNTSKPNFLNSVSIICSTDESPYFNYKQDTVYEKFEKYFIQHIMDDYLIYEFNLFEPPPFVNFVVNDSKGLDLRSVELKKSKLNVDKLDIHYGEGFTKVNDSICSLIKKQESGLIILRGVPGSGKTTYAKWLMKQYNNKRDFIYMLPDMVNMMQDINFTDFLLRKCHDSVFLIEDGEKILLPRDTNPETSSLVSTVLNFTDGIPSDATNILFIVTLNGGLDQIDPALTRKGRLKVDYEFKNLTEKQIISLNDIYNKDFNPKDKKMILSDFFNENPIIRKDNKIKRIGF